MVKREVTIKNEQGENINISVIGSFVIPGVEKEYMMYSMIDENEDNSLGAVLIGEVVRDGDTLKIVGVNDNERDIVVAYYNELSEQMGGE